MVCRGVCKLFFGTFLEVMFLGLLLRVFVGCFDGVSKIFVGFRIQAGYTL